MGFFGQIFNKRKRIQLMGLTHSGKTAMLTAVKYGRNVTDQEVKLDTAQLEKYVFRYKASDGNKYKIKSFDFGGYDACMTEELEKCLNKAHYYIYILDIELYEKLCNNYDESLAKSFLKEKGFTDENPRSVIKELIDSYLYEMCKDAKKNKVKLVIVGSHADKVIDRHEDICRKIRNECLRGYENYTFLTGDTRNYEFDKEVLETLIKE